MKPEFSVIQLMLEATWVVQAVVLLLILASILSWAAIFRKGLLLRRVQRLSDEFERDFWSGGQLNELYQAALQRAPEASPTERIFASGMREFHKLRDRRVTQPDALLDGARRAMRASLQREVDALEANMSFLGSVGSVAPYVGLFGTVWGIMHAFTGIGAMAPMPVKACMMPQTVPNSPT